MIWSKVFDRYDLYELCVQSPSLLVPLLRAIHGSEAKVLAEDFCGTAALSRRWVAVVPDGRAVGVDIDPEPMARARGVRGLDLIVADVFAIDPAKAPPADILFVGNFSIAEIHERPRLIEYLRLARSRLSEGGVFICDTYGGEGAYQIGHVDREHEGSGGERILYRWEQREADPLTARVVNALHFRVFEGDEVVLDLADAFVYDWRLWSVPELRDAMTEAGFQCIDVYARMPDAVDTDGNAFVRPIEDPAELDDHFIVCVAARSERPLSDPSSPRR